MTPRRRHLIITALSAIALGAAAGPAAAMVAPTVSGPPSPSNAASWTFTIGGGAGLGDTVTGYEGGVADVDSATPADPIASPYTIAPAEGTHFLLVRAVGTDISGNPVTGPYRALRFVVDRTPPAPPVANPLGPPDGDNGWYRRNFTVTWTCSDPSGASCPPVLVKDAGAGRVATQVATDGAGNVSAPGSTPPFNFDNDTWVPAPLSPVNGATLASEPTYTWAMRVDPTSGDSRWQIYARWAGVGSDQLIAQAGPADTSVTRNVRTAPLPRDKAIRWYLRLYDKAGNFRNSDPRTMTIASTPPARAPSITGGPTGATRNPAPTFSWSGDQPAFTWDVTAAGSAVPAQQGQGPATSAPLTALPDGDYVFRVSQTTAAGDHGLDATRRFSVDTVAPGPPAIIGAPAGPLTGAGTFTWATESGASSTWRVLTAAGALAEGPSDTPATSARVGPFPAGAYIFEVTQTDPAGNVSPPARADFSPIVAGPVKRPVPTLQSLLPRLNVKRLWPRPGKVVPTRRPVLRWTRGPRGTTLYNVQIFRVTRSKAGVTRLRKVSSTFPRKRQMRTRRLAPAACYVWRVWPYQRRHFAPRALGVSNFCVASKRTLHQLAVRKAKAKRAKARLAKSRRAARAAAAARGR